MYIQSYFHCVQCSSVHMYNALCLLYIGLGGMSGMVIEVWSVSGFHCPLTAFAAENVLGNSLAASYITFGALECMY